MNYAELSVMQASRAKTFSAAQTDAMAAYCQAEHDLKELQAEDDRLRELVRDIADHINHGDGFGIDRGWMLDRMRELGIEVDE